jgi:hypothetical protein
MLSLRQTNLFDLQPFLSSSPDLPPPHTHTISNDELDIGYYETFEGKKTG